MDIYVHVYASTQKKAWQNMSQIVSLGALKQIFVV